ncbi:MAG: peptide chain release factor N(5)-glutamine methyltransferase [Betaproteobacteria bacterium]
MVMCELFQERELLFQFAMPAPAMASPAPSRLTIRKTETHKPLRRIDSLEFSQRNVDQYKHDAVSPVKSNPAPNEGETVQTLLSGNGLPRSERLVLLSHALGMRREALHTHPELVVSAGIAARFHQLIERRRTGEPIAYLVGWREFFGVDLRVTPDVLIPRPDTETLVEAALRRISQTAPMRVLDVGSGSGAIAIALASLRPSSIVEGVDISDAAVEVGTQNASRLGLANVKFRRSDWYGGCARADYDVIVSNPPYIAGDDPHLTMGDLRFEPALALTPGTDGLAAIRLVIAGAGDHLIAHGWLLIEHGYDQAEASRALMASAGFESVVTIRDLGGNERVCEGRWPG